VILVDSSAWVEFDRATGSAVHLRLRELIAEAAPVAVTEPIVMEVRIEARVDFDGAARIYRRCRTAGVTPRGLIDCMVASVAQRNGAALLAHDADLARIAEVIALELDEATLRA